MLILALTSSVSSASVYFYPGVAPCDQTLNDCIYAVSDGDWVVVEDAIAHALQGPLIISHSISLVSASVYAEMVANGETCGSGLKDPIEACDDNNLNNGDGCSSGCTIEEGFTCTSESPSVCTQLNLNAGTSSGGCSLSNPDPTVSFFSFTHFLLGGFSLFLLRRFHEKRQKQPL